MKLDDWLMAVVLSGFAMTFIYIVAEYLSWRSQEASDLKVRLGLRDLYKRLHSATKPLVRVIRRKSA